jgi:aldose 1-epimerase
MEAEDLMPTGRLVDIEDGPADLRVPIKLSDLDIDDVFWGMEEEHPATIYYDDIGKKLTLHAADFFTHCVVYTPEDQPYFCIENQSCSTDAHNLHVRGFEKAAHLTILDPGTSLTAWIEFRISDQ